MNPVRIIRNCLYLTFTTFLLCTSLGADHGMVNGLIAGKINWFCRAGLVLFIPFLLIELYERRSILRLRLPDLMMACMLGMVLITYNWHVNPDLPSLLFTIQNLLLWFLIRQMCSKEPLLAFCFIPVIFITALLQVVLGFTQVYDLTDSQHALFQLTGFFPNPGPYSGYLAFILPIAIGYMFHIRKEKDSFNHDYKVLYYLAATTALLIVMVLPSGMSRSAWLAAILSTGWVVWKYRLGKRKYKLYIRRKPHIIIGITVIGLLVLGGATFGLYHLKKDSADGRLLMWKITAQTFLKNPVRGTGIGGFPAAFAETQAEYMESGKATPQEKWVAGCPETAFNEYLQILVEVGIFGFLFFIIAIGSVIYISYQKKRYFVVGGILSFLIFSFSSYPLHDPSFLPVLVVLSTIGITDKRTATCHYHSFLPYVIILLTVLFLGISVYQMKLLSSYKNWTTAKVLYTNRAYPVAAEKYADLYDGLCYDRGYLFEYAQCLAECEQYSEAITHLHRASLLSSDPMIHYMIGKNKMKQGYFEEAENVYIKATHMVPQRIYPYFLMTELYSLPENYQPEKLQMAADSVLYKKPKVENQAVWEMREKVNKLLIEKRNEQNRSD